MSKKRALSWILLALAVLLALWFASLKPEVRETMLRSLGFLLCPGA